MLLNALNAEELFANWLAIVPWEIRLRTSEDAPNKAIQDDLSSAWRLPRFGSPHPHSALDLIDISAQTILDLFFRASGSSPPQFPSSESCSISATDIE